ARGASHPRLAPPPGAFPQPGEHALWAHGNRIDQRQLARAPTPAVGWESCGHAWSPPHRLDRRVWELADYLRTLPGHGSDRRVADQLSRASAGRRTRGAPLPVDTRALGGSWKPEWEGQHGPLIASAALLAPRRSASHRVERC